jgi:hypothetical protein
MEALSFFPADAFLLSMALYLKMGKLKMCLL